MTSQNSFGAAGQLKAGGREYEIFRLAALEKAGKYSNPVVTEIAEFTNFYPAEDYHDDYYDNNRSQGYCMVIIDPKIKKLLKTYGNELKEEYK